MENKDQNNSYVGYEPGSVQGAFDTGGVHAPPPDENSLSLDPETQALPTSQVQPKGQVNLFLRMARRLDVILVVLLLVGSVVTFVTISHHKQQNSTTGSGVSGRFGTIKLPLSDLVSGKDLSIAGSSNVTINGPLQLTNSFLLTPSLQPTGAKAGQIYYDKDTNQLAYYNGSTFVFLTSVPASTGLQSLGASTTQISAGNGLSLTNGQISNAGVLSVQGAKGDVTFTAGAGIVINGTNFSNSGVLSVASTTPGLAVTSDGNGHVSIDASGLGGTGTVTSSGGTVGSIALFTGSQNVENSIVTQSGLTVTITGDLSVVTGGLTLSTALTVSNGGTGATSLAANGVLVGQGTAAVGSVAAGSAGLCLLSTAGAPTWGACPSGGGVTSLNSLTGGLSIANASAAGSTITIDDASTVNKGIASFNSTNFTATGGAVNTVQDINTGATPTFAGVNTNNITPGAALTVGVSAQTALLQGSTTTITSNGAGNDIVLNSANAIDLQDNTFVSGDVTASGNIAANGGNLTSSGALNITPGGALTVGAGSQALTLQGGPTTSLRSTSGANTTIVAFTSPTANTTLNFPALAAGTYTICTTSGNCAGAGVTLQAAYSNSSTPEITLDATRGALTVRDNSTPLGANLLEVQDNTGGTTYLAVTSSGVMVTGTATVSGNINSSTGALQTGGTNRVDNSGNLVNIAAVTASGSATFQGGSATLGTNSQAGSIVLNDGSSNTGTLQVAALGQNTIYTLPDPGVGAATICLTTGNCAGTGTGVTTTGGTTNRLAKFSGSQAIADSTITDNGTTVTTTANLVIQGGSGTVGVAGVQSGSLALAYGGGAFTGTLATDNLTASQNYTLPNASGSFCLTSGNCAGVGGTGDILQGGNNFGTAVTLGTNDNFGFNLETNGVTRVIIANDGSQVALSSGTDLILQGATAYVSNSQGQASSEAFGLSATVSGANAVAVGNGAGAVANAVAIGRGAGASSGAFGGPVSVGDSANAGAWGVAVGQNSSTSANNAIAVGNGATAGLDSVALGAFSSANQSGVALGYGAATGGNNRIVIGHNASATADNQLVIGSSDTYVSNAYIGNGVTNATPQDFTLHGTGGSGTDVTGATVNIAGGAGTGAGIGGNLNFQVATPGVSGSSANVPATVFGLSGATGSALFKNLVNSATAFQVQTAGGAAAFTIDTATNAGILAGSLAVNGGNITSTGALNITPAGTLTVGAVGQQLILQGSANTKLTATGGGFTTTVGFNGTPTADVTYNLDRSVATGTYTICTSIGNCAGSGGGVTTVGGTTGTLAVFTGSQTIADSLLSQSGSVVTINGNINLTSGNKFTVNGTQISSADLSNDSNLAKLGSSQTFTGSTVAFKNGVDSTNAFNVQNAAGNRVVTVDTTGAKVTLGVGGALDGTLVFANMSNANTVTILPGTPTANRTLTLPDASGIICTNSGNCAGAGATLQTGYNFSVGGTTPKIKLNSSLLGVDIQDADTTIGADLFDVRASNVAGLGSVMFGVGNTGAVTLQNSSNSTAAFRLLTSGGTSVLTGDTSNGQVILGQSGTLTGTLIFRSSSNANTITLNASTTPTANRTIVLPNEDGTLCVQNSANCGFALSSGNNNYIQNQSASDQTGDFRITGTGRANTALQSPLIDTPTAAILAVGTTNATAINLNQNTTIASGKSLTVAGGATSLTGATTGDALVVSNATSTGNIALFKDNSSAVFTIADGGSVSMSTTVDTVTAFTVQGTAGQAVLSADTFNNTAHLRTLYSSNTSTYDAIWLQGPKNGVTALIGGNDDTSAYLTGDFSSNLRFNGSNVAWGDFGYYPRGGGNGNYGVFRFSTTGSVVSTTPNAKVGVGDLYVNGNAGIGTSSPGYTLDVAGDTNISSGSSYRINGVAICTSSGCTPTAGSSSYIQNQNAAQQSSSNFWVSGTGRADTALQAPIIDTPSGTSTLQLGTTNASGIQLAHSTFFSNGAARTFYIQTASSGSNGDNLTVAAGSGNGTNKNGGSLILQGGNSTGIGTAGGVIVRPQTDVAAAFQIQNASSATLLNADTSSMRVSIGSLGTATGQLYVSGSLPTSAAGSVATSANPRYVTVVGNYAYVTNSAATPTLQIFDVSNPASPVAAGSIHVGSTARKITVSGKYAYVTTTGDNAFRIIDISNPASPTVVNTITTGTAPIGIVVTGKYAYVSNNTSNSLQIFDVSNPASVGTLSTTSTGFSGARDMAVSGRRAYVVNQSSDNFQVFDISNPASPSSLGAITTGTQPYAVAVSGRYVYAINNTSATLQVFDMGGAYIQSIESGNITTGSLTVSRSLSVLGSIQTNGGLSVGGASRFDGSVGVNGTQTIQAKNDSTSVFKVLNASGGSLFNIDSTNAGTATLFGMVPGETSPWNSATNTIPAGRYGGNVVTANGYVYQIGGNDASSNSTSTVYYAKLNSDGSVGTWTTSGNSLPAARARSGATVVNGYVYVVGGINTFTTAYTTVYYAKLNSDGSVGTWQTATNSLPAGRQSGSMASANGYMYFVGGQDTAGTTHNDVYYTRVNADGSVGTWTTSANPVTNERNFQSSLINNGYLYIMGGQNNAGTQQSTVYYSKLNASDGSNGTWTTASNALPAARAEGTPFVSNGYVYLAGGQNSASGYMSSVIYARLNSDGSTGVWGVSANSLPAVRASAPGITVNGYMYVISGWGGAATTTVYYSSASRVQVGASLDLVGLQGQSLTDAGSDPATGGNGGSITAGNGRFVGGLDVIGQANFSNGVAINGAFTANDLAAFQNHSDTSGAFQVLNASGVPLFSIDTSSSRVYVGNPVSDSNGALLILDSKNTSGDPSGVNGGMYYNSSRNSFRCYENDMWVDCLGSARVTWHYINDFIGTQTDAGTDFFGTGGSWGSQTGVAGHPGVSRLNTGTTTNGWAASGSADAGAAYVFGNGDTWKYEMDIRVPTLSDGTNNFTVRTGMTDGYSSDGVDGCFFKYNSSLNGGKWQAICESNSTQSTCDTGITVNANQWYRLTLIVNSSGTLATFYADGSSTCSISSNIPTSAGRETSWNASIVKAAGTTSRAIDMDYVELQDVLGTSR